MASAVVRSFRVHGTGPLGGRPEGLERFGCSWPSFLLRWLRARSWSVCRAQSAVTLDDQTAYLTCVDPNGVGVIGALCARTKHRTDAATLDISFSSVVGLGGDFTSYMALFRTPPREDDRGVVRTTSGESVDVQDDHAVLPNVPRSITSTLREPPSSPLASATSSPMTTTTTGRPPEPGGALLPFPWRWARLRDR